MNPLLQPVQLYYDEHVVHKLKGFVEGNIRVEKAWKTIEQWAPKKPQRILEVGCGVGDISWRMSRYWPEAEVVGLDISPKAVQIANQLFASSRVSFVEGVLTPERLTGMFDLIVLIDTYEHISVSDRPILHAAIQELRHPQGRIVLSIPTPRHLSWLKQNSPHQIQPVDEDIDIPVILQFSQNTDTEILMYQELNVWRSGDYAHIVLGTQPAWDTPPQPIPSMQERVSRKLAPLLFWKQEPLVPKRSDRLALVKQKLGSHAY